jgi:hypothetical protein
MPTISTGNELLAALGAVIDAADPIAELRSRGFTLAPELARVLDTPEAHARLRSAERQRLLANVRGRRAPKMQVGPLTRAVAHLEGRHHDLTIGLKLEKVNEVLADVYAKRSIPRDISLGSGNSDTSLGSLLLVLRNELIGVPAGDDIRIGLLRLTGPPSVTALPTPTPPSGPDDISARFLMHLPFTLDIDRIPASGPGRNTVTTLSAVAHFGIKVTARVEGNTLAIGVGPMQLGEVDIERLRLTINADSALQPKTSLSGDAIGLAIELGGFRKKLQDLAISTTLAPRVTLPIGEGFDLFVRHIDLRAVPTAGAGHLMVGLEIGREPSPPLSGQPKLLERDPFDASGSTLYVEAHAELFKEIVKQGFASGELQRIAVEQASNVRLKGADAELGANSIGIFLFGTLVDECGVFGENFKDVGFAGWHRVELRGVDAGHIRFETVDSLGIGDANFEDIAICVLLSFLDLKILSIGKALLEKFFSTLSGWLFGSSSSTDQIVNLFDPNFPIPMTELLPRVRALGATIDATAMRIQAALDLVPDTINTYVYVRCVGQGLPTVGGGLPVKGVHVRLLDQDVPPPPRDDAPVPIVGTIEGPDGRDRWRTVTVSFRPTLTDQELASGTTDSQGRVQLVISPSRLRTSAGVVTTTTIVEDLRKNEIISVRTQHRTITEPRPDVYFLLEVQNRPPVDTRNQIGGFIRNLESKRWGTAEQPLVFRVQRPQPGIEV